MDETSALFQHELAQATMVSTCLAAGFDGDQFISSERLLIPNMDEAIAIEVKSTRGYFSEKGLMGKGNKIYPIGYPKLEHLMQTGMYLHTRKVVEDTYGVKIPYAVIVYGLVDSCKTNQFRIELSNGYDGEILVKGENVMLGYWKKENETNKQQKETSKRTWDDMSSTEKHCIEDYVTDTKRYL